MFSKGQPESKISKLQNGRGENPTKKKDEIECSVLSLKTMFRKDEALEKGRSTGEGDDTIGSKTIAVGLQNPI